MFYFTVIFAIYFLPQKGSVSIEESKKSFNYY